MNLSQYFAYPQRRLARESAIGWLVVKTLRRYVHKRTGPTIYELASLTPGLLGDAAALFGASVLPADCFAPLVVTGWADEHSQLEVELKARYRRQSLSFPVDWAVEDGTSFLLYALIRGLRPATVVEIGVGNGVSSFYILNALRRNRRGQLHSLDISQNVGDLVSKAERLTWDLRIINKWRGGRALRAHLDTLPPIDVSFHDGDHGYLAQYFEFACLWDHLAEAGILLCDDIDASHAFADFCRLGDKRPEIFIDRRKAVGVLRRSNRGM